MPELRRPAPWASRPGPARVPDRGPASACRPGGRGHPGPGLSGPGPGGRARTSPCPSRRPCPPCRARGEGRAQARADRHAHAGGHRRLARPRCGLPGRAGDVLDGRRRSFGLGLDGPGIDRPGFDGLGINRPGLVALRSLGGPRRRGGGGGGGRCGECRGGGRGPGDGRGGRELEVGAGGCLRHRRGGRSGRARGGRGLDRREALDGRGRRRRERRPSRPAAKRPRYRARRRARVGGRRGRRRARPGCRRRFGGGDRGQRRGRPGLHVRRRQFHDRRRCRGGLMPRRPGPLRIAGRLVHRGQRQVLLARGQLHRVDRRGGCRGRGVAGRGRRGGGCGCRCGRRRVAGEQFRARDLLPGVDRGLALVFRLVGPRTLVAGERRRSGLGSGRLRRIGGPGGRLIGKRRGLTLAPGGIALARRRGPRPGDLRRGVVLPLARLEDHHRGHDRRRQPRGQAGPGIAAGELHTPRDGLARPAGDGDRGPRGPGRPGSPRCPTATASGSSLLPILAVGRGLGRAFVLAVVAAVKGILELLGLVLVEVVGRRGRRGACAPVDSREAGAGRREPAISSGGESGVDPDSDSDVGFQPGSDIARPPLVWRFAPGIDGHFLGRRGHGFPGQDGQPRVVPEGPLDAAVFQRVEADDRGPAPGVEDLGQLLRARRRGGRARR